MLRIILKTNVFGLNHSRIFNTFRILKGFQRDGVGYYLPDSVVQDHTIEGRVTVTGNDFRRYLIYSPLTANPLVMNLLLTPIYGFRYHLPEEIPIYLAFFHMSSVVRYKPHLLSELKKSRYWSFFLAMERHCSFKMLLLFYNLFTKTSNYLLPIQER